MRRRLEDRLVDEMLEAYAEWRETCHLVDVAYGSWASGREADAGVAFARYSAALDMEEAAAADYADLVRRVRSLAMAALGP